MAKKLLGSKAPKTELDPAQTAQYTAEFAESLGKIAFRQGQLLLAHFLELAAFEARSQAIQAQETRLPE